MKKCDFVMVQNPKKNNGYGKWKSDRFIIQRLTYAQIKEKKAYATRVAGQSNPYYRVYDMSEKCVSGDLVITTFRCAVQFCNTYLRKQRKVS